MTENDTFDALRRVPIREMIILWRDSLCTSWEDKNSDKFFDTHGWDSKKFRLAWIAYNGGSFNVD